MKRSTLYREAARLIERRQEEFCCYALKAVGLDCKEFAQWFKNDAIAYRMETDGFADVIAWMENISDDRQEWRDGRVLALCFLACIAEDEEMQQAKEAK